MRSRSVRYAPAIMLTAVALVAAACGSDDGGTGDTGAPIDQPGTVASPRVVEITTLDTLRFDPSSITVQQGETIKFVVSNPGQIDHEFVVGDEDVQAEHETAMMSGDAMDHDAMDDDGHEGEHEPLVALSLEPGGTLEHVITFDEAGSLLFGCHLPGHYAGGMKGEITIS